MSVPGPWGSCLSWEMLIEQWLSGRSLLSLPFRKVQEEEGFTNLLRVQAAGAQPHVSWPRVSPGTAQQPPEGATVRAGPLPGQHLLWAAAGATGLARPLRALLSR